MKINATSEQIHDFVLKCINTKTPLSHIRIGDGEGILLNNEFNSHWGRYVQKKQIGIYLNQEQWLDSRTKMTNAIINCDIVGVTRDEIIMKGRWKQVNPKVSEILKSNSACPKICSANSHFDMLDKYLLHNILCNIEYLVIVNGRNIVDKLYSKYSNIKNIEYHQIEPQYHYEKNPNTSTDRLKHFQNVVEKLESVDRHGQLLIFGCGIFGKYIGNSFKNAGGVSLDIGSVFDVLAGNLSTRGNVKQNVNKYKNYIL